MRTTELLFPPGATHRDWVADGILAVSLTLLNLIPPFYFYGATDIDLLVPLGLLSAMMTLPLVLRRHSPLLMLALVTVGGVWHLQVFQEPNLSLVSVPIVAYSVARWVPGNAARSVLFVGAIGALLGPLRWFDGINGNPSFYVLFWGACLGAVLTPYAIGRRAREVAEARISQVQAAEEQYRMLLAEREQQARLSEASTRAMIARELHDIVAHSLSVMIVQAEGGRAAATRKPEIAVEALDTIAETGREALHEMRRIVGVLRAGPDDEPASYAPAPTLEEIPDMVARTSDRVQLVVEGNPQPVSQALALTVFRVTQEALTNFLKHAGPEATAVATLTYSATSITVEVVDNGAGVDDPTDGGGNGLRGMYERVSSMGGRLLAGPRSDGPGFRVHAVLPVRETVPHRPIGREATQR